MKKESFIRKIGVVSTTVLMGILAVGTAIANENVTAINNFFGEKTFEKVETGDGNQDKEYYKSKFKNLKELFAEGKKTVSDIEAEGATLLKNDNNALPLKKGNKVSLFSVSSIDPAYGGKGSAQVQNPQPPVTPKDGLTQAGLQVNETLLNFYTKNYDKYKRAGRGDNARINDASWNDITAVPENNSSIEAYKDAAIFTIARPGGGEGSDFASKGTDGENGNYLRLNQNEISVLKGLNELKKQGKISKIVVLLNVSNHLEYDFINNKEYGIDAALWIGTTGISGFDAVGKLLVGDVNPSGHLSDTLWYRHSDNPVHANFGRFEYPNYKDYELPTKNVSRYNSYVTYQEGIYLGYRYAETRYYDVVTNRANVGDFKYDSTIYKPFGYGDSYTTFEYSDFKAADHGKTIDVTLTVTNTGKVAGKDAVQIYAQKPYTEYDIKNGIEKSAVDLVGFTKTDTIEPGKEEQVKISIDKYALATYDSVGAKTYVIEEGKYYLTAGADSHTAVNNILAEQGFATSDKLVGKGSADLTEVVSLSKDTNSFAKSRATGNYVSNLFQDADINNYKHKNDNHVDYMSRSNWEKTYPVTNAKLTMTNGMAQELLDQDDPTKIPASEKKEFPKFGVDNGLSLINLLKDKDGHEIDYNDPIWEKMLDQLTFEETQKLLTVGLRKTVGIETIGKPETLEHNGPAGLVSMYGANPEGLAARLNDPDKDKLNPPYYPCIGLVAATFNTDLATKFGDMLGEDAIWSGYAGLYGIGLNTHRSAYEGRAYEYWSEDPYLAGKMVAKQVKALQSHGCNGYIKHFALNDQETNRSGIQIWASEQTIREIYLKPFEYAVVEGGANNAMASFTRIGTINCPGSKALMTDFLRGELGMKGFVVTDMYQIGYTPEQFPGFVMAGTDLADGEIDKSNVFASYKETNADVLWKMRDSAKRILYSTLHSNAMNGYSSTTILVPVTPKWKIVLTTLDSIAGVLLAGAVGYAAYACIKAKKETK